MTKPLADMTLPDLLAEADRCARVAKERLATVRASIADLESALLDREYTDAAIREWTKRKGIS